MRIDNALPAFYNFSLNAAANVAVQGAVMRHSSASAGANDGGFRLELPGIAINISPQGWAAYQQGAVNGIRADGESQLASDVLSPIEAMEELSCATCDSRRYQDDSDDASVSFQTPTHISPEQSAAVVRAHEQEHVANEQARAEREGRRIVSQTVTLHSAICPECNRPYISGGVTRTISRDDNSDNQAALVAAVVDTSASEDH
jgi:hypothetical protein